MSYTWGPPIWTLFHTIIEHVPEEKFKLAGQTIFIFINRICRLLPCPECQEHAKKYLSNQRVNTESKKALREFIHKFHNMVNRYKKYKEPSIDILDQYRTKSLSDVYNRFVSVFSSRGNIRLLADTMQRNMILKDFKTWLLANADIFQSPSPITPVITPVIAISSTRDTVVSNSSNDTNIIAESTETSEPVDDNDTSEPVDDTETSEPVDDNETDESPDRTDDTSV
jgi:hypothetical protein